MAETLKQTESVPEAYPVPPDGLSTAAAALDADMIWQRLEAYTVWRFTERDVEWIVEGYGNWTAPLVPATIATVEVWQGEEWVTAEPALSPLGYCLAGSTYRFTGVVGGDVPAAVLEAFRRLAEYMAAEPGNPGATSERTEIPGVETKEISRSASWMARAMQNSGAGDLLRPYRRAS